MSNHISVQHARFVQLLDHPLRRHAHSAHKQLRTARDNHIDQLLQIAARIVCVCLSRATTNLRQQKIDTKRRIGVIEFCFCLFDHLCEDLGRVGHASKSSEASRIADCCDHFAASGRVHAGKHHGVLDPKGLGQWRGQ